MNAQDFDRVIQLITERLRDEYSPEKIILFGSYADGSSRPDSDIDLLIIKQTRDRFIDRWISVRRILSDKNRSIGLETLVLTPEEIANRISIGDQFIADIMMNGRLLYAA